MPGYSRDLAYIHHAGFGAFARRAAPAIIRMLRGCRRVVDFGCGTGLLTRELARAGFDVLGIDISPPMIALARGAKFRIGSYADVPPCDAVVAVGEVFNYAFDRGSLFRRVRRTLIFDLLEDVVPGIRVRHGRDWTCVAEIDRRGRRITSFRRVGRRWRRTDEFHPLRLMRRADVVRLLRRAGFRVRVLRGYGRFRLAPGHPVFVARKPAS